MTYLRAFLAIGLGLAIEVGLGRWTPVVRGYLDVMLLPVAWYGIARSARSGMLVGCAGGLLQDAWFETGLFGLNGFVKTLLGYLLGRLGGTFDVNQGAGRFVVGAVLALAGRGAEAGMLKLLAAKAEPPDALELAVRALVTGLLVLAVFAILDRVRGPEAVRRKAGS